MKHCIVILTLLFISSTLLAQLDKVDGYTLKNIEGWKVFVEDKALSDHATPTETAINLLTENLKSINELPFIEATQKRLQKVPIFMDWAKKNDKAAEYHPSKTWLINNGYIAEKAKSVNISNINNYVNWTNSNQPWMILHELSHAYQDQMSSQENQKIQQAYNDAKEANKYGEVDYFNGSSNTKRDAYAATNDREYFAELTEAYFGKNDFYPFNNKELKEYDSKGYKVLEEVWYVVTDSDGNQYGTVNIGDQTWMAENLRTTKCNNGTPIKELRLNESNSQAPGMYWHNNDSESANSKAYGPLYNWAAVKNCNVCPTGWHIPSQEEWNLVLRAWYGKEVPGIGRIDTGAKGLTYAAYQLRETGEDYWSNNSKATNATGFTARPGGWLWSGSFRYLGSRSAWWATMNNHQSPGFTKIASGDNGTWTGAASSNDNLYIRCIKD